MSDIPDEDKMMVIDFDATKGQVNFQVVPARVAIAKKFIATMGALMRYERLEHRQRELTMSQRAECDRMRKDLYTLTNDYEAAVREEQWTRS